jgi:hypothetical protein
LNGKYIINKDLCTRRTETGKREGYKTKAPYISGTPMKIPKQTPPNGGPLLISFLERHFAASRPPENTSTRPKKTPLD